MATLVTGGYGTIGANIVRELAARGHQVISLDIVSPDDLSHKDVEPWSKQVTWLTGDIVNPMIMEMVSTFHKIDKIVHVATYTPYGDIEKNNGRRAVAINLEGTANLLELAHRLAAKRFIYISSIAVYGGTPPSEQRLQEDMPLKPRGIYGITKYASELLTQRFGELYGFETASLRLSQNWGTMERITPYHSRLSLLYEWAGKAVRGEPIEPSPFGKGVTEGRSFGQDHIYVKDTASFIGHLLDIPTVPHHVYNTATGRPLYLDEMVSAIREAYPEVKIVGSVPKDDPTRKNVRWYDVSRMQEVDFAPQYDLVSALKDYINWRQTFNFMDV